LAFFESLFLVTYRKPMTLKYYYIGIIDIIDKQNRKKRTVVDA